MSHWSLTYDGFDPEKEALREALCTLGNGYFATRGAAAESEADDTHYPGTYLAGGYDRATTEIAGREVENEDLVNLPNWLPLDFRIEGGPWFNLRHVTIETYKQRLDLRHGVLSRRVRFKDEDGRTTSLEERRFVHMGCQHLAGQEIRLRAEDWSGTLELRAGLDGRIVNGGVERYRSLTHAHLEPLEAGVEDDGVLFLKVTTRQSELRVAQAARVRIAVDGDRLPGARDHDTEPGYVATRQSLRIEAGQTVRVEKVAALYTSRDPATSEAGLEARKWVRRAGSFDELLESHRKEYDLLWQAFTLDLELREAGGRDPLRVLRLHLFHLMQTVSLHTIDQDVGVPARGWHGEAYRGHIFWDELFILPTLNVRLPDITRSLLRYRFRRLQEARWNARSAGFEGALFPWQSGSDGREETQEVHLNPRSGRWNPDNTHLQRHVNAAIAYNIWKYYQATQDLEFLSLHGAETFLEIARFWSSITEFDDKKRRYVIPRVMGPDEYHDAYPDRHEPGLDNNAYTNVMAAWVLHTACHLVELLPRDRGPAMLRTIGVTDADITRWRDISRRMYVPFHEDGLISQFDHYEELEPFDWQEYRKRYGEIQRLDRILEAEGDTPNRYQASKQADVVMLFYLFAPDEIIDIFDRLGYPLDAQQIRRNIEYYLQRSSHGSTLSFVVHAWVLSRYDRDKSWALFLSALQSDVADIQGGTTHEGIHLGAMAGTVDIVQRAFTGLDVHRDRIVFDPALPEEVTCLSMKVHYQGHYVGVRLTTEGLHIRACDCPGVQVHVRVRSEDVTLGTSERRTFDA